MKWKKKDIDTLFMGSYANCSITDSVFQNITNKRNYPVISDLKYSNITLTNTIFENLK